MIKKQLKVEATPAAPMFRDGAVLPEAGPGRFRQMRVPYGLSFGSPVSEEKAKEFYGKAVAAARIGLDGVPVEDLAIIPSNCENDGFGAAAYVLLNIRAPERACPDYWADTVLTTGLRYVASFVDPEVRIFVVMPDTREGAAALRATTAAFGAGRVYHASVRKALFTFDDVTLACETAVPVGKSAYARSVGDMERDIWEYIRNGGAARGMSTGLSALDEIYTIADGDLTVVTGWPGNGKSEFVDQLAVNAFLNDGGGTAIFSPENDAEGHAIKIAEKLSGKPVRQTDYDGMCEAMPDMAEKFFFLSPPAPTYKAILLEAEALAAAGKIKRLIIDPYNKILQDRGGRETETEFVARMLNDIQAFAKRRRAHVWFVAHPKKTEGPQKDAGPPTLSSISGSQHWYNMTDNGLVVARQEDGTVKIIVKKIRHKRVGRLGECVLNYDLATGRYSDRSESSYSLA